MREDIRKIFESNGVGYYNIENKENKENRDNCIPSSLDSEANASQSHSEVTPTKALLSQEKGEASKESVATASPTPEDAPITQDYVHRALFTFYDNGEHTKQRYKFQIRINPAEAPSEAVEFIATLTKDRRNFKKYLPEGAKELLEFADTMRSYTKKNYGTYPYIGKMHFNHGWRKDAEQRNTNEPWCACAVWWDGSGWSYALTMYDWQHRGTLSKQGRSKSQIANNVQATDFWQNPAHNKQERNPTFQQMRKR